MNIAKNMEQPQKKMTNTKNFQGILYTTSDCPKDLFEIFPPRNGGKQLLSDLEKHGKLKILLTTPLSKGGECICIATLRYNDLVVGISKITQLNHCDHGKISNSSNRVCIRIFSKEKPTQTTLKKYKLEKYIRKYKEDKSSRLSYITYDK